MKSRKKMTVNQMVLIALAACINTAGGQAALALRLPVYLDSIGTILAGILLGPLRYAPQSSQRDPYGNDH